VAWQKFFGFDKNGAYADMAIDVDLDALTMTCSSSAYYFKCLPPSFNSVSSMIRAGV
jgi:hypothetical protein